LQIATEDAKLPQYQLLASILMHATIKDHIIAVQLVCYQHDSDGRSMG